MARWDERGYFEAERALLEDEARAFSKRYPDIANNLELDATRVRDPHVARLLEGFCYLHGRMRRFLDRQFPELVHALFEMAYPLHLRPVPCKTLVQFDMRMPELIESPITIPRGTELMAAQVGPRGDTYTFTTCWPVSIQPVKLTDLFEDLDARGDHCFTLKLEPLKRETATSIQWDELEFTIFDASEKERAFDLYLMFSTPILQSIKVRVDGESLRFPLSLEWCGFDNDHNYHPEEHGLVSGRHFPRDFFDEPQRFFFFKIKGLQEALGERECADVRLDFAFNEPFAPSMRPKQGNILLGCCVAQNIFDLQTEPIRIEGENLEYPLLADAEREDIEIYSLYSVVASKGQARVDIKPYYQIDYQNHKKEQICSYTVRRDPAAVRGWQTYLQFQAPGESSSKKLDGHLVSVLARCTNRHFAERLGRGQLDRIDPSVPESVGVKNITAASAAAWPRLFGQETWDFVAHLSLDFAQLTHLPSLRRLLDLYTIDRATYGGYRPAEAIQSIHSEQDYHIHKGACLHGRKVVLVIDGGKLTPHRGEVALFARMFAIFLQAYCPINGFIRFVLEDTHYKRQYQHLTWG